jgi:hypothetical protein
MSLLAEFLAIVQDWRGVFPQQRTFQRGVRQALGSLVCLGRRCLTRIIWTNGGQNRSWSAEYFLHSRCQWEPQQLFQPILKRALAYCPQRLVGVAIDDTRLRKTGRAIPQAFYQRDPLSPPFHVNLVLGLRFLQASLLVPLHRNAPVGTRALPIRFQEVSRVKRPGKKASEEMQKQYREAVKQKNLSRSFVDMGKQLRQELDQVGGSHKVLVLAGDGSFCNRTCFGEIPERTVLLARARKDAKLCFRATEGARRFYALEKFTPEQVRKDENRAWKTSKIFYGGKRRKIRYKEVTSVLWQRGAKQRSLRLIVIAPTPYRKSKSKKLYYRDPAYLLTTDLRSSLKQAIANLFRPLADRGQSPRRKRHAGYRPSSVVECYLRAQTAGLGRGCLQRLVAGFPPSFRRRAWGSLCPTSQVAAKRPAPFLLGSDHSPPQRNGPAAPVTRSVWLSNHRSGLDSRCCRLRKCRNSRDRPPACRDRRNRLSHLTSRRFPQVHLLSQRCRDSKHRQECLCYKPAC